MLVVKVVVIFEAVVVVVEVGLDVDKVDNDDVDVVVEVVVKRVKVDDLSGLNGQESTTSST